MLKPNAQCAGIRRWGFWRWLGHEGGALMNGISALIKKAPKSYFSPSTLWGHNEKSAIYNLEEGSH